MPPCAVLPVAAPGPASTPAQAALAAALLRYPPHVAEALAAKATIRCGIGVSIPLTIKSNLPNHHVKYLVKYNLHNSISCRGHMVNRLFFLSWPGQDGV